MLRATVYLSNESEVMDMCILYIVQCLLFLCTNRSGSLNANLRGGKTGYKSTAIKYSRF